MTSSLFETIEWCQSPNYGRVCGLADDKVIFSQVKAGYLWEPDLVGLFAQFVRPGSIAIDAGANIGLHSIAMAVRQPEVRAVYSFEPHPEIFPCLEANAKEANATFRLRIEPFNKALGSAAATLAMPKLSDFTQRNPAGVRISAKQTFPIEVIALDSLALTGVSLIKIDVEGWEIEVIRGALDLIRREKPTLIVELLPDDIEKGASRTGKIEWISGLGYKPEQITGYDFLFMPA